MYEIDIGILFILVLVISIGHVCVAVTKLCFVVPASLGSPDKESLEVCIKSIC